MRLEPGAAVTVAFVTLSLGQLWNVFNMRDPRSPVLRNDIVLNGYVWGALGLCVAILGVALYVPVIRSVLDIVPPSLGLDD